ncbi:MAG: ABC transporter permease [Candidatus Margulisbacteria bacterium]|nr:ABC transporter permease [Candidatus Margulisiibacteriota bacterium]
MPYNRITEKLGNRTLDFLEELGKVAELGWQTVAGIFTGKTKVKLSLEQIVKIGYESLPLAIAASAFVGMVFAVQVATEFVKFGAGKYVGGIMAIAMARELGPALAGIVIAARVSAAITAEIGTMQVTEQIEALQALGSNPVRYLVIPRFIACATMMPILTIASDVVGFLGGYLVGIYVVRINPVEYMDTARSLLTMWDIWGGLIKTIVFGMMIAIIACYRGLSTKGGAKGVGEATTSSVVTSLIAIFVVNYFLSLAFFK